MELKDLIRSLRERSEPLCLQAANELESLNKKYMELGEAYDSMQKDLLFLLKENRELKMGEGSQSKKDVSD